MPLNPFTLTLYCHNIIKVFCSGNDALNRHSQRRNNKPALSYLKCSFLHQVVFQIFLVIPDFYT